MVTFYTLSSSPVRFQHQEMVASMPHISHLILHYKIAWLITQGTPKEKCTILENGLIPEELVNESDMF